MSHNHKHETPKTIPGLIIAIGINIVITVFEIILGIMANSLALISDAAHNLTDIGSMVLGYVTEKMVARPANDKKTYGYKKMEFVTAFVNGLILLLVTGYILYEGVIRLFTVPEVVDGTMFYVGLIALLGNAVATWILTKSSKNNTNMQAVWLHSLQDALSSLGVVMGAVIIKFTGWNIIDPIISILIAVFLIKSIYHLIKRTVDALLDSVPEGIDYEEVKRDLLQIKGVVKLNDLHIWLESSRLPMLSVHLQIGDVNDLEQVFQEAKNLLFDKYHIEHTTVQVIPVDIRTKCKHCN